MKTLWWSFWCINLTRPSNYWVLLWRHLVRYKSTLSFIWSKFHSFVCGCPVFPTSFNEDCPFPTVYSGLLCQINWPHMNGFTSGFFILYHWAKCFFLCYYHTVLISVIVFELKKCNVSSFAVLSQDCFGYSESALVPYKFLRFYVLYLWKITLEFW